LNLVPLGQLFSR